MRGRGSRGGRERIGGGGVYADRVHLRLKICCQQSKWVADVSPACCHQGGCEEQLSMDLDFHGGTLQPGHRQWGHH